MRTPPRGNHVPLGGQKKNSNGARAPTVDRLLKDLARARARRRGADTARFTQRQNEALSVIIRRANARMLLRRLSGQPMTDEAWRRTRARAALVGEPQAQTLGGAAAPFLVSPPPFAASSVASPPPRPVPLGAVGDARGHVAGDAACAPPASPFVAAWSGFSAAGAVPPPVFPQPHSPECAALA
eukprot:gene19041-biopygen1468